MAKSQVMDALQQMISFEQLFFATCSERLARSQVEGKHQKEACSINKSLSSLGDVFSALASKQPHVPYRNSKLTHLLQVLDAACCEC